jgi:hypothetical protein
MDLNWLQALCDEAATRRAFFVSKHGVPEKLGHVFCHFDHV